MSFLLSNLVRYATQKLTTDPQARDKAAKAARIVAGKAGQIARSDDKAREAGRALRRALNKLQGDR